MKKLLGIVVLGLLWCNVSSSDDNGPYVAVAKHKLGDQLFESSPYGRELQARGVAISMCQVSSLGKYNPSGLENSKLNELGNPTISTNKILSIAKGAIFTGNPNPSI